MGGKEKPVQRAVSLAQRAAAGGNAQPAAHSPAGSTDIILFFILNFPSTEEHCILWMKKKK